ncbi:hypothetical protein M8J75_010776 [Diaphorina citri]|nr:hypothetical protein M8J75_010776 [Diaphorina citri]
MATIDQIKVLLDEKFSSLETKFAQLDSKSDEIKKCLEDYKEERKAREEEQVRFMKRSENNERNKNLIIHGIKEKSYHETLKKIMETLTLMEINIPKYCISNIVKLGKKKWDEEGPILMSLISTLLKQDILRNRIKLNEKNTNISIKEDMSSETRETRKKLAKFSLKAKQEDMKVQMRGDKLMVNGKKWTLKELEEDTQETYLNKPKRNREEEISPEIRQNKKIKYQHSKKKYYKTK